METWTFVRWMIREVHVSRTLAKAEEANDDDENI
jgi:hypothetical protein